MARVKDSKGPTPEMSGEAPRVRLSERLRRLFRLHLRAYALGAPAVVLVDLVVSDGWWFFWPILVWGLLLAAHYLFAASLGVDDDWAQRRADEVADKAYDFSHIEDIRQRYESVKEPRAEEKEKPES